jgi:hypothetical protein
MDVGAVQTLEIIDIKDAVFVMNIMGERLGELGEDGRSGPFGQWARVKGKGFQGSCYQCGEFGHPARECPKGKGKGKGDPKGKGKGKGFQGSCYQCGEFGHPARECPKGGGKKGDKGKGIVGQGILGGKGKGISMADYWPGDSGGSGETLNLGGSVEEVEPGVQELERESGWQTAGRGKRWGHGGRPDDPSRTRAISREKEGETCEMRGRSTIKRRITGSLGRHETLWTSWTSGRGAGEINEVHMKNGWEKVRVQVDSGAIDTVAPREVAAGLPIRETEGCQDGTGLCGSEWERRLRTMGRE